MKFWSLLLLIAFLSCTTAQYCNYKRHELDSMMQDHYLVPLIMNGEKVGEIYQVGDHYGIATATQLKEILATGIYALHIKDRFTGGLSLVFRLASLKDQDHPDLYWLDIEGNSSRRFIQLYHVAQNLGDKLLQVEGYEIDLDGDGQVDESERWAVQTAKRHFERTQQEAQKLNSKDEL